MVNTSHPLPELLFFDKAYMWLIVEAYLRSLLLTPTCYTESDINFHFIFIFPKATRLNISKNVKLTIKQSFCHWAISQCTGNEDEWRPETTGMKCRLSLFSNSTKKRYDAYFVFSVDCVYFITDDISDSKVFKHVSSLDGEIIDDWSVIYISIVPGGSLLSFPLYFCHLVSNHSVGLNSIY